MEYDPTTQEFVLDEHDQAMLAVSWPRVPAADVKIILAASRSMHDRATKWKELADTSGNDLAQASAARDLEYCEIYGRNLINTIHFSARDRLQSDAEPDSE
jgi:hypothetical protein